MRDRRRFLRFIAISKTTAAAAIAAPFDASGDGYVEKKLRHRGHPVLSICATERRS
jgi:hypothetical protein